MAQTKQATTRGIKTGDIVEIHFLDHVQDGEDALEFKVYGEVAAITRTSIRVLAWAHADKSQRDVREPYNESSFVIVKRAILSVRKLR